MTTITLLNIVLAVLVVGAIVSLLAWGIATDAGRRTRLGARFTATSSKTQAESRRRRRADALGSMS
jgi:hypothetical protein